jgi:hypothetical protein
VSAENSDRPSPRCPRFEMRHASMSRRGPRFTEKKTGVKAVCGKSLRQAEVLWRVGCGVQ